MQDCRDSTLSLFESVSRETLCAQAHPDFSPIGWHLGHIGYTEALWILDHLAGNPPQSREYCRLFAADGLPKIERGNLPGLEEMDTYLATIRQRVFEYLEGAPLEEQERFWWWLLQHECQHAETIALVLALHQRRRRGSGDLKSRAGGAETFCRPEVYEMVRIPAGSFQMGSDAIAAQDNERPTHTLHLETYWIDRYPVTCAQYRRFMEAGGYRKPHWWSSEGWQWLDSNPVNHPLYWSEDADWDNHPVCGVNYYEAEAYARFVDKRLPTEAEWEKAARWNPTTGQTHPYPWGDAPPSTNRCNHNGLVGHTTPVDAYPLGGSASGCADLLGNVWEWTASWFKGYPGFTSYPYRGYSEVYFDGQHRVLRGGSWVTRPYALRSTFRNWYHPHVRQIFAGFRCARSISP